MNLREALDNFGFPKLQITTENVNKSCITFSTGSITPIELLCCVGNSGPAINEILTLGAVITPSCYGRCRSDYLLWFVELIDRKETSVFMNEWCKTFYHYLRPARVFIDYGAEPPKEWWVFSATNPDQLILYYTQVRQRVAACRAALLALGAYCMRSPYTGLRPVYKEIAKEMWRMRGGGERCGPRGERWE